MGLLSRLRGEETQDADGERDLAADARAMRATLAALHAERIRVEGPSAGIDLRATVRDLLEGEVAAPTADVAALVPAARAATVIDRTAECLRSQPVCGSLTASERDSLTREIDSSGAGPMFIAVLPSGSAETAVDELHARVQRPGTYAVVAGHTL